MFTNTFHGYTTWRYIQRTLNILHTFDKSGKKTQIAMKGSNVISATNNT